MDVAIATAVSELGGIFRVKAGQNAALEVFGGQRCFAAVHGGEPRDGAAWQTSHSYKSDWSA